MKSVLTVPFKLAMGATLGASVPSPMRLRYCLQALYGVYSTAGPTPTNHHQWELRYHNPSHPSSATNPQPHSQNPRLQFTSPTVPRHQPARHISCRTLQLTRSNRVHSHAASAAHTASILSDPQSNTAPAYAKTRATTGARFSAAPRDAVLPQMGSRPRIHPRPGDFPVVLASGVLFLAL